MKATISVEAIGHNSWQMMREWHSALNSLEPGLGKQIVGNFPARWGCWRVWADGKLDWEHGKTDYSHANSKGSRGIRVWYTLESGRLYLVASPQSWGRTIRYFCTVSEGGEIKELSDEEARAWLLAKGASESTCLKLHSNG